MILDRFETRDSPQGTRVSAALRWEDTDRPDDTLYFASRGLRPEALAERPEAFVLAAFPLAQWSGERRLRVEGVLCPRLREGVELAIQQIRRRHVRLGHLDVEASRGTAPAQPAATPHAAMMLSGGIDSMALLRQNRLDFAPDHPTSIRTGVFCYGLNTFDFEDGTPVPDRRARASGYADLLEEFAGRQDLALVRVETNARALYPTFEAWGAGGWEIATVAAGLAAVPDATEMWLASDAVGLSTRPTLGGKAPLASSAAVDVRLGGRVATRLDATRLVADWEGAGDVVRSCLWFDLPPTGVINCGACEKCVRTMLALVATGRSEAMSAFPMDSLSPESVRRIADSGTLAGIGTVAYYDPLPPLLRAAGRDDLAGEVDALLQGFDAEGSSGRSGWLGRALRRPD